MRRAISGRHMRKIPPVDLGRTVTATDGPLRRRARISQRRRSKYRIVKSAASRAHSSRLDSRSTPLRDGRGTSHGGEKPWTPHCQPGPEQSTSRDSQCASSRLTDGGHGYATVPYSRSAPPGTPKASALTPLSRSCDAFRMDQWNSTKANVGDQAGNEKKRRPFCQCFGLCRPEARQHCFKIS